MIMIRQLRVSSITEQHVKAAAIQRVGGSVLQHGRGHGHLVRLHQREEFRDVGVVREFDGGVDHENVLRCHCSQFPARYTAAVLLR